MLTSLFLLMSAIAVLPLLWLLLRERGDAPGAAADPAGVYAAQYAEVARDRARGALDAAAAGALEAEIGRRLLAATRAAGTASRGLSAAERAVIGLGLVVLLPAASFAWYEGLAAGGPAVAQAGPPGTAPAQILPGTPPKGRDAPHDLAESAARLAERLDGEPENVEGWVLLARSYGQLGRSEQAARAYRRIAAIASVPAARLSAIAEDIVAGNAGTVSPEARDLLTEANRRDPAEPRARFFLGLARAQSGETGDALDLWLALERDSPPEAPWLDGLRANIARLAEELGLAPAALAQRRARVALATTGRAPVAMAAPPAQAAPSPAAPAPAAPRGPTAQDMAAAARLNADDRAAMIRGMVEGLAARLESEPGDVDGWLRLGRAWRVLGETERGLEALARAARLAPGRPDALAAYSAAIAAAPAQSAARHPPGPVHDALLALARPDRLQGLGDEAAEAGDKPLARRYWERARDLLPADSPARGPIEERLGRLGAR